MIVLHSLKNVKLFCVVDKKLELQQNAPNASRLQWYGAGSENLNTYPILETLTFLDTRISLQN